MENRRYFIKRLRSLVKLGFLVNLVLIFPRRLSAKWAHPSFEAKTLDSAIFKLFGHRNVAVSDRIDLSLPDEAQDGAVVPITIQCDISGTDAITVFVENNPVPLIANVELMPADEAFFKTRIRMAQSDFVTVVVKANNKLYRTRKFVKVAIGGC